MADEGLRSELAVALQGRPESGLAALNVSQRLAELQDKQAVAELVSRGPPEGSPGTWGSRLAAALRAALGQEHSAAFVAFDHMGGYWRLLELLSDAQALAPSERQAFYAQFEDAELVAALLAALTARGASELVVRRCVRNLARSATLRQRLAPAVPALVGDLAEEALLQASAAALCNIGCHSDAKEQAVAAGAVPRLLLRLRGPDLRPEVAEDLVACLGVLTGGCQAGIAALFEVANSEGEALIFGGLLQWLRADGGSTPDLQGLVLDVLGGLCAASPQCRAWLVRESPLVREHLPQLLRCEEPAVRMAALQSSGQLVDAEGFVAVFQEGGGVGALQSVLERESERPGGGGGGGPVGLMAPGLVPGTPGRGRAPAQRELAQYLLSKILI